MMFLTDEKLINAFKKAIPVIENIVEEHKKNNPSVHKIEIPIWEPAEGGAIATELGLVIRGFDEEETRLIVSELSRYYSNYDAKWIDAHCPYMELTV